MRTGTKRGFTLIEALLTISIIVVMVAASVGSYSAMTRAADKARARDLVQQVAQALAAMHDNDNGQWPLRMAAVGETGGKLDDLVSYQFVATGVRYLTLNASGGKLIGYDRFGVLDPWGMAIMKRKGPKTTLKDVEDHLIWFAVDEDGDGVIEGVKVGGEAVTVRATAIAWCGGKDGKIEPYSKSHRSDDVHSWTVGQTRE